MPAASAWLPLAAFALAAATATSLGGEPPPPLGEGTCLEREGRRGSGECRRDGGTFGPEARAADEEEQDAHALLQAPPRRLVSGSRSAPAAAAQAQQAKAQPPAPTPSAAEPATLVLAEEAAPPQKAPGQPQQSEPDWRRAAERLSHQAGSRRAACAFALGFFGLLALYLVLVRTRRRSITAAEEEETPMATQQMLRLPQPTPRLRQVGTSFVVPLSRIASCKGASLNVDIPVMPAVWPLRALFSRPQDTAGSDAPWPRLQLTVDIIDAAGLPPLLCCERAAPQPGPTKPPETGGTQQQQQQRRSSSCTTGGGTGGPDGGAEAAGSASGDGDSSVLCFEVRGGSGAVAAAVAESAPGKWSIHRPGHAPWHVARREVYEGILFTAYCRGEEVALATRQFCSTPASEDDCVQVDTLMDSSSPDSLLLFCCMLALLAGSGREA